MSLGIRESVGESAPVVTLTVITHSPAILTGVSSSGLQKGSGFTWAT